MISALRLIDGRRSVPDLYWRAAELGVDASHMTRILDELIDAALVRPRQDSDVGRRTLLVVGRGPLADAVAKGLSPGSDVDRTISSLPNSPSHFDCVVLADHSIPDPGTVTELMRSLTPHVPVRLRDGCGVVGPLVLPGHTSCLRCADLVRCEYDQEWPYLAAQLFGTTGTASATTVAATAALAVAQVDALLTRPIGPPPTTLGRSIEVDVERASLTQRMWPVHRLCGCTART
ncbi:hypothetical protein ACNHUS_00585 [Actinomycetes bacterium M1A6_2h]